MTINSINSSDSFSKISQQIDRMEKSLNNNGLNEVDKINLIPKLEQMFSKIKAESFSLTTRPEILNSVEMQLNLASVLKTEAAWARIYHECMAAKLSSLNNTCIDTELAFTTNTYQSPKTTQKQYELLKKIKSELLLLSQSPLLNEEEKLSAINFLPKVTDVLALIQKQIDKEEQDLAEITADDQEFEDLSHQNTGWFASCSDEIFLQLFSFFSTEDLVAFSRCSKFFHNLCKDESVWKMLLQKAFPSLIIPKNKSAKETYVFEKAQESMINSLKSGSYTCFTLVKQKAFSCLKKEGNFVFTGCLNVSVKVWDFSDLSNIEYIASLKGHQGHINCLHIDGNLLFSGSFDKTIKIWDLNDLTNISCIHTLQGHKSGLCTLQKKGNHFFSSSHDGHIKVWDLTDLNNVRCTADFRAHQGSTYCLQIDGDFLISGSDDNSIKIWDLSDLDNIRCIADVIGHQAETLVSLYKAENLLFSGFSEGSIKIWDLTDLTDIHCIATLTGHQSATYCFSKNGNLLFSGSKDSTIRVWDLTTYQCVHTLIGHQNSVCFLQKEGDRLFSGAWDNTIRVWDLNVSLEDTLLNLIDIIREISDEIAFDTFSENQAQVTFQIFFDRIQSLPPLIQNQLYTELGEIGISQNAEHTFLALEDTEATCEKKIEAISRYLLKQVISFFQKGKSKKALRLFNNLPEEIKNAVCSNDNTLNDDGYIEAINKFLIESKMEK